MNSDREKKRGKEATFDEGDVEVADGNDEDGAREVGGGREVEGGGVVVEGGEARSEGRRGDVVLDEAVHVDDGGGAAELDAGEEDDHQLYHWEHRFHHSPPRRSHCCCSLLLLLSCFSQNPKRLERECVCVL